MKQNTRLATALLLVGLAASSVAYAEIIEQILVKVNGELFTKTDLENRQVTTLRQRGSQLDLKDDPLNQQLRQALDSVTPQIMVDAIDEMLIVQRGKELGYRLSDEQFKSVLENIKKENKLESDEQFEAALKQENMTLVELRRNLERQMIVQRVQQNEVMGKIGVTELEARAYYDSHIAEFTTPPSVALREILITIPADAKGINVAVDEETRERVEQIRKRIVAGESFEKLSSELSDSPSRANAGLIGPISVTDLSPELRKVVESLKVGGVTEVMRTPRGYQLLKLESSTPTETLPFEQAREQISDRVFTDKRKQEFQKYLEKLRSQAIIEWKNQDVRKAYEEGLAQQGKQG
jgi:peptidyl-prolyl cis-trans isomerase SurA